MRLTTFILMISLLQVSASTFGQRFTMQKKNASLNEVFTEIRKQTGYFVIYADDKIDASAKLDINFKQTDLKDVLSFIGKSQELQYTIDDKNISFKPKDPTFLERLAERWADRDVVGRIVDAEGKALPGATVKVKATGKGVSTDVKGNFHLKNVEDGAVLMVSYTGYISKEVKAEKDMGNVVLEVSLSKLDEVQVIAYGTTTQRLSTGNITTIKADVIEKQPVNNPLLALQGRVPGLFIEQATGFAGTGVKVRIQGQNSNGAYSGNDPFYIVDGIPWISQLLPGANEILGNSGKVGINGNPLTFLNPSDIESIDILKDADATAIYGSRAANGAVLITTKKGKAGETKIDINLQSGWANVPRKLDLMDSEQYLEMRRSAFQNDGISTPAPGNFGDSDFNGNWSTLRNTDWQNELIGGTANYQNFNTSISGGNDRTSFLVGAGYQRQTNVFPGKFEDKRATLHFNISNSSKNQKFRMQFSGSYLYDNNALPNRDLTGDAIRLSPVAPELFNTDGSINWEPNPSGQSTFIGNPIGYIYNSSLDNTNNLSSNLGLSYEVIPGLNIKSSFGYTMLDLKGINKALLQSTLPEFAQYSTRRTVFVNNNTNSWIIEPQITYGKMISKGTFEVLVGATLQQNLGSGSQIAGSGFTNDLVMDDLMSAPKIATVATSDFIYKYNAIFGRINYNWQDKYIVNLTGRRDGSSRFGSKNQFHNFGAFGGAWIFSNEPLVKEYLHFLSFGKVRASYGTTGSDQIQDYLFLNLYSPLAQDIPYQGIPVYKSNGLTNPYLQWEETKKLQFGLDLGVLKDKILLNINYYINNSSNQLSKYDLPSTSGFSEITKNQAYKIRNSGWELMLSTINIQKEHLTWSTNITFTEPKTLLAEYPDVANSSLAFREIVGNPLTSRYVYHYLGVDPATGNYQFVSKDGNPTFSPKDPTDKTILIDLAPKFYGGFQNSLKYKSLQLDVMFTFVKQIGQNHSFGDLSYSPGRFSINQPASVINSWKKPGDVASTQKFTTAFDNQALRDVYESDAAWKDASYIRLKNVSFSWQLPEAWSKKVNFRNSTLFVHAQNLWTATGYMGLDPETKSSTILPPLRLISLGLKVGL